MYQIGFDIGGTNIKAGLLDEQKKLVTYRRIPFPKGEPYKKVAQKMKHLAEDLVRNGSCTLQDVRFIGAAVPGNVDKTGKRVIHAHNIHFHHVPFKAALEECFPGIPIALLNDADAAALAELEFGVFRGKRTALLLTLGTGVGSGLILDGELFSGGRGHGVEFGHMTLEAGGAVCTCGRKGCVETLCSGTWLLQQGRKAIIESPFSLIYSKAAGRLDKVNAKMIIECAKAGDGLALDIYGRYLDSLSSAIASVASLLDPEIIALGGGVSLIGDFLYRPLNRMVKEKVFFKCEYPIVPSKLGNDGGIMGAATYGEINPMG